MPEYPTHPAAGGILPASVPTYTATIYCGLKLGYDGATRPVSDAEAVCQAYCDDVSLCVSVTPTKFVYKHGSENGVAVGLINYPRFPSDRATIYCHALELAARLRDALEQQRVSVVFPDETIMLGGRD